MNDLMELSNNEKTKIDKLLLKMNLENCSIENCGKIKSCTHISFSKSSQKRNYWINKIADKNFLIALYVIKELDNKEELYEIIWEKIVKEPDRVLDGLICSFYLQKEENSKYYLKRYIEEGSIVEFKNAQFFFSQDELWNFISYFINSIISYKEMDKDYYDEYLSKILNTVSFSGEYLDIKKEEYLKFFSILSNKNFLKSKNSLIVLFGVERLLYTFGYKYEQISQMISDFPKSNRLTIELDCCNKLYKDDENIFQKFRNNNLPITKENIKWYYISLLNEYKRKKEVTDILVKEFDVLDEHTSLISAAILKDEKIFMGLAESVYICLSNDDDIFQLLYLFEPINACKNINPILVPYFEFKTNSQIIKKSTELVEKYIASKQDLHKLFFSYFNSYLKYYVDLNLLIKFLITNGYDNDSVNEELKKYILFGKIKYKDAEGLSIAFRTATVRSNYIYKDDTNNWKKYNKGQRVGLQVQNSISKRKLLITDIWDMNEGNYKKEDDEKKWNSCIDVIENIDLSSEYDTNYNKLIKDKSNIPIVVVQKLFDRFTNSLEKISDSVEVYKNVLANLIWNIPFLYCNDQVFHGVDFRLMDRYEKRYVDIFHNLLQKGMNLDDFVSIYVQTFVKAILPINVFMSILEKKYDKAKILACFNRYSFLGNIRIDDNNKMKSVRLLNVQARHNYFCYTEDVGRMFFKIVSYDENSVEFDIDYRMTREVVTQENIQSLLRRVDNLSKTKNISVDAIKRLKQIPFEDYVGNKDICMKLASSVTEGICVRRSSPNDMISFIKALSFRNPYCARRMPFFKIDYFSLFQYDENEIIRANKVLDILILNGRNISNCFFIYINSFLKLNVSFEDFFEKCYQNSLIEHVDFELIIYTIGVIEKKDEWYYKPTDISINKVYTLCQEDIVDYNIGDRVCGVLKISYNCIELSSQLVDIIALKRLAEN